MKLGTIFGIIFLILFTLKLGVVDTQVEGWSWWLVTAPLWAPTILWAATWAIIGVIALLGYLFTSKEQRKRNAAKRTLDNYRKGI